MKRLTIEQIKIKLRDINPNVEILSDVYINNSKKLKCKCLIDEYEFEMNWNKLKAGRGCHLCAGNMKLNIDIIKHKIQIINPNITIISESYKNNRSKIHCKCELCKHEWDTSWDVLNRKHGCPQCAIKLNSDIKRYNINIIKQKIKGINPNIEILSKEYNKNSDYLLLRCKIDNHMWVATWNSLQSGKGCPMCVGCVRLDLETIKTKLNEINPNIKILSTEYKNSHAVLKCKCAIDDYEWNTSWTNLSDGHGCPQCAIRRNKGSNSHLWNGGVTELFHYLRGKINSWKLDSMRDSNYKCIISGEKFDEIHHVYNFHKIVIETLELCKLPIHVEVNKYTSSELYLLEEVCLALHYYYGMGVCLSKDMHKKFHMLYGYRDNTKEQFEEFVSQHKERINV